MKKVLSILIALVMICGLCAMTVSADSVAYEGYSDNSTPEWRAVYVPINDYSLDKVTACGFDSTHYRATVPGYDQTPWENHYNHPNDANRIIAPSGAYDFGMEFTAPAAGNYTFNFSGYIPQYYLDLGSDGLIVRVFDSTMTMKKEVAINTATATDVTESFTLAAGEKFYVFFNMGPTQSNDSLYFTALTATYTLPPLSEAVFTPKDTSEVKTSNGAVYNQWFDVANDPDMIGLWTGFYVSKVNTIELLVPDTTAGHRLLLPENLRGGDNQYMAMWEGIGNATAPIGEYTIGDYFTAPVAGTVTVNATFAYNTPADQGDGIFVTVYKNKIADENILIAKTLFDNASSAQANTNNAGLSIKAENVEVAKGDVLIFVYDYNQNYWSDNLTILAKNVTYTNVTNPDNIFNPDTTKVQAEGNTITALKTLTFQEMMDSLGANAKNLAAFAADGTQITDPSVSVTTLATLIFYNDVKAACPVGVYSLTTVDSFGGAEPDPGETPEDPGDDVPPPTGDVALQAVLALLCVSALGITVLKTRKK